MLPFGRIWYIYNLHYEKFADGTVKCIEDEIPFELPEGWAWCRLSQIITLYSGQDLEPSRYNDEGIGIPYITGASNLENGKVIINRWTDSPTTRATIGDLLITCKGSGVGKMAWCSICDAHIARQIMALRCIDGLYSDYLEVVISAMLTNIKSKANGLIPGLSRDIILGIMFPLPPFEEQKLICIKCREVLSYIDNIDNQKTDLVETIDIIKSRILDLAIRGKLVPQNPDDEPASVLLERIRAEKEELIRQGKIKRDKKESVIFKGEDNSYYEKIGEKVICIDDELPFEIPASWSWTRFGNIVFNYDSQRRPITKHNRVNDLGLYDYYGATGAIDKVDSYIFDGEYLMIGEDGGNFFTQRDNSFIASGRFWANNHVHIVQPVVCDIWYLKHFLDSCDLALMGLITGIGVPKLNQENMNKILVPIPPIEEQDRIAFKVKEIYSVLSNVEKSLN